VAGSFTKDAVKLGFSKMVDQACKQSADAMTAASKLSTQEKQGVEGLLCESMTFIATLVTERKVTTVEVGSHLISNGIGLGKLTRNQQVYCMALKTELAVHATKLAGTAFATFGAASTAGTAGIIAGGIQGTVVAGPYGTMAGAIAGGIIGAGGPLLLGSYEMYETVATITDLAIDIHSQCGPLAMTKAPPARAPMRGPALP
jgi:hypothetical protein